MKIFDANITPQVCIYLKDLLQTILSFENANQKIQDAFGIVSFFPNDADYVIVKESLEVEEMSMVNESDRAEYGDFQTNRSLALQVVNHLSEKQVSPEIVIEPTCGKGNFIIASLSSFKAVKKIFGVEIYKPYVWETKFNIIDFFLTNPRHHKPEISIIHSNIFDFNFKNISLSFPQENLLVIGNPPWVTNSKLGSLNSTNLPLKSNFKNQSGLDAMTGKGNFDIAESISTMLFDAFQHHRGSMAFLVKNSVIKNIVFDQKDCQYRIGEMEMYNIDSKKEFNVSVEASLFICQFNSKPGMECGEFEFYRPNKKTNFGWLQSKFVSNIDDYKATKNIDGVCPFEWRQGLKHDCANVMELERVNGHFVNKLSEEIILEENLIHGLLKSSDLKNNVVRNTRKHIIVTQTRVGQDTSYIQHLYPTTYAYLKNNIASFQARKSSIYIGKPLFSIFGIGEYSFKPYKVAISGLYKTFHFSLVLPINNKPVMLDDTCYFIGFERLDFAIYALILLNYQKTESFLKSITFADAKRVFTKDILMRIDLLGIAKIISQEEIEEQIRILNELHDFGVTRASWDNFIEEMTPVKEKQLALFGENGDC